MRKKILVTASLLFLLITGIVYAQDFCIECHRKISPGQVKDWQASLHAEADVSCDVCHGDAHKSKKDYERAVLPSEQVCGDCHEDQYEQFSQGKHNFGWKAMNAIPATHIAPDELMEAGGGCGGCHNMGIKTDAEKKERLDKGYRYQNNSCDECHTRHSFSKKEALDPKACQQCHMGYDHPQWEMWSSSKHGTRYLARQAGNLPETAVAPKCQDCHMKDGNHNNHTAWGFLGVRLPLPEDPQWRADQITILKALAILDPETGERGPFYQVAKELDFARLDKESFDKERNKMISICSECHSEAYVKERLALGDAMMSKLDRMLAEAIETVAALYRDGLVKKPDDYPFNYPFLLMYMETGGVEGRKDFNKISYIDQVLLQMYMKHRMRGYQGFFHINPDYAYWYGYAQMTKDLGEIKELAKTIRAVHRR
ncbi:MAG TPA: cytochrome C [Calditrichaeota bacterium]|nr:cytochrome C [Calditrichota bacterium]